jgi:hypothetical protein
LSGTAGVPLATRVNFEESIESLDNEDSWTNGVGFEGDVGNPVNFNPWGEFNPEGCISG